MTFPKLLMGNEHHNLKTKADVGELALHPCSGPATLLLLEDLRLNLLPYPYPPAPAGDINSPKSSLSTETDEFCKTSVKKTCRFLLESSEL